MFEGSGPPDPLDYLGVALVAFGLGCHFSADRLYRTAGLLIGAAQMSKYAAQMSKYIVTNERIEGGIRLKLVSVCDRPTAILLVMASTHSLTSTLV